MATLTIRGIDDTTKERLEDRARANKRSMEAEVRALLSLYLDEPALGLGSRIVARFQELGGVDLDIPPRTELGRAADFG